MSDVIQTTGEIHGTYGGTEIGVEAAIVSTPKRLFGKTQKLRLSLVVNGTVQDQQEAELSSETILRGHRDPEKKLPITVKCKSYFLIDLPWKGIPVVGDLVNALKNAVFSSRPPLDVMCEILTPDTEMSEITDITYRWSAEDETLAAGQAVLEFGHALDTGSKLLTDLSDDQWATFVSLMRKGIEKAKHAYEQDYDLGAADYAFWTFIEESDLRPFTTDEVNDYICQCLGERDDDQYHRRREIRLQVPQ